MLATDVRDEEFREEQASPTLDEGYERASRSVAAVAERLDRFFFDDRTEEGINATRVRFGLGVRFDEGRGVDPLLRFRLDLSLPRTQRRLALVIASLNDEESGENILSDLRDDGNVASFLRLLAIDRDLVRATIDGGLRFSPEPDPFVRLRFFREFPWGRTLFRPTQQFFWRLDEGVGEQTRLDIDRRLSFHTLVRLRSMATYSEVTPGVELDLAGLLFRQVHPRSGFRFEVGIRSFTDPPRVIETYRTSMRYRRAAYRDWLFVEIEPQLHFRREHGYRFSPGILLRIESVIGRDPNDT